MYLSRGIDGDLSDTERRELVDALLTDPELAQRWKRYHAIGDCLREGPLPADITARVSAALANEAPLAGGKVLSLAAFAGRRRRLAQPAIGLALAASVAVATVVGLRVLWPQDPATTPASVASAPAPQQLLEGGRAGGAQFTDLPAGTGAGLASVVGPAGVLPAGEVLLVNQGAERSPAPSGAATETGPGAPAQARLAEYLDRHERRAAASLLLDAGVPLSAETRP